MKKIIVLALFVVFCFEAGCQEDKTFKTPVTFEKGFYLNGKLYTDITAGGEVTWDDITGKPVLFSGSYNDLTDKPAEIDLQEAISQLSILIVPKLTAAQIASLTPLAGSLVYDTTAGVLKLGNGTVWKTLITSN